MESVINPDNFVQSLKGYAHMERLYSPNLDNLVSEVPYLAAIKGNVSDRFHPRRYNMGRITDN